MALTLCVSACSQILSAGYPGWKIFESCGSAIVTTKYAQARCKDQEDFSCVSGVEKASYFQKDLTISCLWTCQSSEYCLSQHVI